MSTLLALASLHTAPQLAIATYVACRTAKDMHMPLAPTVLVMIPLVYASDGCGQWILRVLSRLG
jgi:hypothetical protein